MSLASRVRETTTVTGTGDATLLGAAVGYTGFTASYGDGVWAPYLIQSADGLQYEEGIAPMSGSDTLQRSLGRVFSSSAAGARVDFKVGTKTVDALVQDHVVATRLAAEKTAAGGGGGGGGAGDASAVNQGTQITAANLTNTRIGAVDETAAASDTATSGLNGRLQRIAQRLTSLIAQLPSTLGIKTAANSLSVAPASDAAFAQGAPRVGTTTILAATTSATGSLWVAFGSQACTALDVVNTRSTAGATPAADAAVAIRARRTSTTDWVTIRAGGSYMLTGLTNANQVEIQREDQSNTQLPVTGVALA
jgi:hypothetical protein